MEELERYTRGFGQKMNHFLRGKKRFRPGQLQFQDPFLREMRQQGINYLVRGKKFEDEVGLDDLPSSVLPC